MSAPAGRPEPWRVALTPLVVAAVGALGALVLGEYELYAGVAVPAGLLLGLVLGEAAILLGRTRAVWVAVLVAAVGAGAMGWAGWIDASSGLQPVKAGAWLGAAAAALAGGVRVTGLRRPGRAR